MLILQPDGYGVDNHDERISLTGAAAQVVIDGVAATILGSTAIATPASNTTTAIATTMSNSDAITSASGTLLFGPDEGGLVYEHKAAKKRSRQTPQ